VVILPVTPKEDTRAAVQEAAQTLAQQLRRQHFHGQPVRVEVDDRDLPGGSKSWEWIKKGVPLRVEIGPRDLEKGTVALARRDLTPKEKTFPTMADFSNGIADTLQSVQDNLLARATTLRDSHMQKIDSKAEFEAYFTPNNPDKAEIHGGFALVHWAGSSADEDHLQKTLGVTMRCIPHSQQFAEQGTCPFTGNPSQRRVIFAKAY
jgi:prolyl-tRNA synthetase